MRKPNVRKTNQKAEIILVEVSQMVCIHIAFWLTTIISLINKKDQQCYPKGYTEGSLACGGVEWPHCVLCEEWRGVGGWAFSEAGKGFEERDGSQHTKMFQDLKRE